MMSDSGYDFQQGYDNSIEYYNLSPAYYHWIMRQNSGWEDYILQAW